MQWQRIGSWLVAVVALHLWSAASGQSTPPPGVALYQGNCAACHDAGVPGQGGALDGPGPTIAGGLVLVNSGYAHGGGLPGNVLIAFSVDGR